MNFREDETEEDVKRRLELRNRIYDDDVPLSQARKQELENLVRTDNETVSIAMSYGAYSYSERNYIMYIRELIAWEKRRRIMDKDNFERYRKKITRGKLPPELLSHISSYLNSPKAKFGLIRKSR